MPSPFQIQTIRRKITCILLCVLALACLPLAANASQLSATPASFNLTGDREPLVSLDGLWRFHPGDAPENNGRKTWADPAFDDSSWPLLQSDQPWSGQEYPTMSGFGWYRFTVLAPSNHAPLALQFNAIMTSYQVYVDGKLLGEAGEMPPTTFPTGDWKFHTFALPQPATSPSAASQLQTIHVAIRVWHSPIWASYVGGGPSAGGHLLGDPQLLSDRQHDHDARRKLLFVDLYSYAIAAAIVSITIFGLYLFRPQEREYLWFAILLMAKSLDAAANLLKEIYAIPSIPIFDLVDGSLITCAQIALLLFLARVLQIRRGLLFGIIVALALISPIFVILYWPGWISVPISALLSVFLLLPSSLWMLFTLTASAFRRNLTARLLLIPVLLVQGLYTADNITIALNQFGVAIDPRLFEDPFVTQPYIMHPFVLAELLFLLAMLAFLIRRFTLARRREERWEGALEAARQVQHLLLPEAIARVKGFSIDCVYRPAEVVGGDFFQIIPIPASYGDGDLSIVVGDVAGKGLPAAMMVSMIVGVIRAEASYTCDPAKLAASLNERLAGRTRETSTDEIGSSLTTCLCAHLSPSGTLTMANAGHLPPYLNGREMSIPGALPLGMLDGLTYEPVTFQLAPGDRLTFVSDGVVEAQNKFGELLGFDRTEALSTKSAVEIADIASTFGQVDDITVVTIEFHPQTAAPEPAIPVVGPTSIQLNRA